MKRPWLLPLTPLYAGAVALRNLRLACGWEQPQRLGWPVMSVGNLSTGGLGKTPLVIALARLLAQRGVCVDVLSRGYGRRSNLPQRVQSDGSVAEFGDEPLLIARSLGLPVFVAAERYDAGLLAEAARDTATQPGVQHGGTLAAHLLDDGFQHRQLARDIDILVLNRADWHGSLLPAGNLRESRQAARRAAVLIIPAAEPELEAELRSWGFTGPIWRHRRRMQVPDVSGPVSAFCGIARPDQFFAGLQESGLNVATRTAFRDHHRFTAQDMQSLIASARSAGAVALVTTEKDLVRIGDIRSLVPQSILDSMPLLPVRLTVEIEHASAAMDWLIARLRAGKTAPVKAGAAL